MDWLATDPTGSGDPDFLIMGDLNSYAQEDPIDAIKAGADDIAGTGDDYTNLIAQFQGAYAYSYTFDGQAGYLDHALANASLLGQVTGAADWHINSDEPDVLDYDTRFKPPAQDALYEPNAYRTSDHDPVIVGLTPNAAPTVDAGGPYSVNRGLDRAGRRHGLRPERRLAHVCLGPRQQRQLRDGRAVGERSPASTAPASFTVKVQATDPGGLTAINTATINVINVAPTVGAVTGPAAPVKIATTVTVSAPFTDPASSTRTLRWSTGVTAPRRAAR